MHVHDVALCVLKGTRHQQREAVTIDETAVLDDRRFVVIATDEPRSLKTVQHPGLTLVDAAWDGAELALTFPDGTRVGQAVAGDRPVHAVEYWGRQVPVRPLDPGPLADALSNYLGTRVEVAEAQSAGDIVYGANVSLWFASELERLEQRLGAPLDPRRFRLTFGVDDRETPVNEGSLVGRRLRLGGALLEGVGLIDRCAIVNWDPATAVRDQPVLTELAQFRRDVDGIMFGLGCRVVQPGTVRLGDAFTVEES